MTSGPRLVSAAGRRTNAEKPPRRNRVNLATLAYDRIEELIVTCALEPGLALSIQDLQQATGIGRTPIHQAVSRLAADTLITIRPRHGLQIAPIDLTRERTLLPLRRDLERFVVRLAAQRSGPSQRNQILHIIRTLGERQPTLTIGEFNRQDRRIDQLLSAAAGEPFLEHTLRPLHTIFRRIGWVYHSRAASAVGLEQTTSCHLAILEAVADRSADAAAKATDRLIDFCESMFDVIEREIDPVLLNCNFKLLEAS